MTEARSGWDFTEWLVSIIGRLAGDEDPLTLGVARAVIAGVLLVSALCHIGAVAEYFSDESMLYGRFAALAFPSRRSIFFDIGDPWAVRAIFGVGVVALALWCVGLFTRVSGFVGMFVWISLYGRNPLLYAYPDQLAMVLGFLLLWMPAGRGFSLDARWRGLGGPVPLWCRRVLQLQLAILYVATGYEKTGETWDPDGTAIYYTVVNPYNRHYDVGQFAAAVQPWLLRPLTLVVLCWERWFGYFVILHWVYEALGRRLPAWGERAREGRPGWPLPDLRWVFLGFGAAMHLGIQLSVYVVLFSPLVVGTYVCFLTGDDLRGLVGGLRRLLHGLGRRLLGRGSEAPPDPVPSSE